MSHFFLQVTNHSYNIYLSFFYFSEKSLLLPLFLNKGQTRVIYMSDNNYQEVIKNNKLFDGIPPGNLKLSFREEQIIRRKEGEIIFQKGDESRNTYLMIAGRVKIKVYIENKSVKLNKTINDFFGEIEVLEDTYRRSAAVANTDCILYALTRSDLRAFLAENPEINDNIIAYNKVEIPELQITINPGLLKQDTDKLYLTPLPEDKPGSNQGEDTGEPERNELEDKRREIEKTAEMILEINGDEEEYSEDESAEDVVPDEELPEEKVVGDDTITDESNSAEEQTYEETREYEQETEPVKEIAEADKFPHTQESDTEENIPEVELENTQVVDETDAEEDAAAMEDSDIPDSFKEMIQEKLKDKSNGREGPIESEIPEPKMYDDEPEDLETEYDNVTGESGNSENEAGGKIQEEALEENEWLAHQSGSKMDTEDQSKWINLSSTKMTDEIPDDISEEEKLRYEVEDERLKYDDTEINAGRILDAIRKINSSFDKRRVYSNIVRESVKLTEAQAGMLYRVDSARNELVTEIKTEDGLVEARYSLSGGLTGLAAETGEIINVREPVKDFRYSEDVDSISGLAGSSIMCVPVKNEMNDTIAIICLANSSSGKFSVSDEEKMSTLAVHISQALICIDGIASMLDENKNIYLSRLTRYITDNIQTPVLTMKYYAAQIKKKDVPQEVRTVLSVLMDQADSVVDFLHSTLAFTENRNPLKIEASSLQEVMDDALGLLAEYVESRNVGLYKKVESNIKVKLDKEAFYQACHQIAKNACDAMGENGNIYITAKQSGDLVNIEFRDTGPGIPDEYKGQIFQPFKSFKKEKGTGLGLTIAQKIIRDHGGELTVESSPDKGATFIISLPIFDEI